MKKEMGQYQAAAGHMVSFWKTAIGTVLLGYQGEITVAFNGSDSICGATNLEAALKMIEWA